MAADVLLIRRICSYVLACFNIVLLPVFHQLDSQSEADVKVNDEDKYALGSEAYMEVCCWDRRGKKITL